MTAAATLTDLTTSVARTLNLTDGCTDSITSATARCMDDAASLRDLADAMDAESRDAWTAELVKRGHDAAELAGLSGLDLAKLLVG